MTAGFTTRLCWSATFARWGLIRQSMRLERGAGVTLLERNFCASKARNRQLMSRPARPYRPEAGLQQKRGAGVTLLERNFCAIGTIRQRLSRLPARYRPEAGLQQIFACPKL